ncbi:NB-ARC domain-containing protein [Allokutzneria sp. A3M-2-11 16]|uniref:tetratricopeptide repeat protein n=1 Tax=Allokutzneria sp. A3M-2-11 16 TaxID=2962043 RepID=UPI0020B89CF7|nr:tetratricopeptide repeat protein [Allokutzneria sp. A3M-2-11 16]MCP3802457.1 NB-ARC domain-containing protein [Allokutzneria sp. A3M-2-11 16]
MTENRFDGIAGKMVQAGQIHGDVHFHDRERPKPHQLPPRLARLVNQRRVLDALAGPKPLKVLLGMRGSGKSSVGNHFLHERIGDYPDGQLHANLGGWTEKPRSVSDILADFLVALGEDRATLPIDLETRQALYRSLCWDKAIQVFLDDAVVPAQVRALLPGSTKAVVVVTGQGAFGSLKRDGADLIDVEPLEDEMARVLLEEYADDRVADEPEAVKALLRLCGGLPIALCVVGALLADVPELRISELLDEFDGNLSEVSAVFDAAYRRLGPAARTCYELLGLYPGDGDVSFGALAAAADPAVVREGLRELRVRRVVEPVAPGRFVVHGLVRAHARGLAKDSGERVRMLRWYLAETAAAEAYVMANRRWRTKFFPDLVMGAPHEDPRGWLETERANLTGAVRVAGDMGELLIAAQLCLLLWSLHEPGKYVEDLLATHEIGILAARELGLSEVESVLLTQRAFAERHSGRLTDAEDTLREAAERGAGDPEVAATAEEALGLVLLDLGRIDDAFTALSRNLSLAMEIGDRRRIALAQLHFGKVAPSAELFDSAAETFRELNEPYNLGKVLTWRGKTLRDRAALDSALAIMREQDRPFDIALVLEALGDLSGGEEARAYYTEALALFERLWLRDRAEAIRARLSTLN